MKTPLQDPEPEFWVCLSCHMASKIGRPYNDEMVRMVLALLAIVATVHAGDPSISVRFHMAVSKQPGRGQSLVKKRFGRENLFLERKPFLTIHDLTSASVQRTDTRGYNVAVQLSPEAFEKTRELTRVSHGKRIAILIENEIVMAPVIRGEAKQEQIYIAYGLTDVEAELLAARINAEIHQR